MFRNKNKTLTITIEDQNEPESEEIAQQTNIERELEKITSLSSPSFPSVSQNQLNERNILLSKNNTYLTQLLTYMESENYLNDISFKHLSSNCALQSISDCIFSSFAADLNMLLGICFLLVRVADVPRSISG